MSKTIKDLLDSLGGVTPEEAFKPSPAERLGRVILDTVELESPKEEDRFVDVLIDAWKRTQRNADEKSGEDGDPVFETAKRPVPIRAGAGSAVPVDYADMPAKQFRELKKQLKKAALDGRKVKI